MWSTTWGRICECCCFCNFFAYASMLGGVMYKFCGRIIVQKGGHYYYEKGRILQETSVLCYTSIIGQKSRIVSIGCSVG